MLFCKCKKNVIAVILCIAMVLINIGSVFATEINIGVATDSIMSEREECIDELLEEVVSEEELEDECEELVGNEEVATNSEVYDIDEDIDIIENYSEEEVVATLSETEDINEIIFDIYVASDSIASKSEAKKELLDETNNELKNNLFGVSTNVYYGFRGVSSVDYTIMYLSNTAFDSSIYGKTGQYTNANQLQGILSVELKDLVKKVVIMDEIHPTGLFQYFYNLQNLEVISCENNVSFGTYVKTDSLTNKSFDEMFKFCQSLRQVGNVANVIDLDIDTSQVTSMEYMFYGVGTINATFDLCTFDTGKVTNMDYMFQDCKAKTIYASTLFSTSSLTTSINMFDGCISLEGSEGTTYDSVLIDAKMAHIDMYFDENDGRGTIGYFSEKLEPKTDFYTLETGWCIAEPASISYIKFAEVNKLNQVVPYNVLDSKLYAKYLISTMSGLWCVLTEETVSKKMTAWITAPKMSPKTIVNPICTSLFSGFASVEWIDLSMMDAWNQNMQFTVAENTDMQDMFGGCATMSFVIFGQKFDTKNVTNMKNMFQDCANLRKVNFDMDTQNLLYFTEVFERCATLSEIIFGPKFNASKVSTFEEVFAGCANIKTLDISMFSFAAAQDCRCMFQGCTALTTVKFPTNVTAPNLWSISAMFAQCSSLQSIDLSGFDTSQVTEMDTVFSDCISLRSVKLGNRFKTSNTTTMSIMFNNCPMLTSLDLSSFDTHNVFRFSGMFASCSSLKNLNISSFTGEALQRTELMFATCSSLVTIELGKLNTPILKYAEDMFIGCTNLKTIKVPESFVTSAILDDGANMFLNCPNLVGGSGTTYDVNHVNKEYARIDSIATPGYFTKFVQKPIPPKPIPYPSNSGGGGGGTGHIAAIDAMINKNLDDGARYGKPNSWVYDPLINKWFRIGAEGKSIIGWHQETNGAWYFLGAGYMMQEGYNCVDGKWYYFASYDNEKPGKLKGQMYVNEPTPDGRFAGADGVLR